MGPAAQLAPGPARTWPVGFSGPLWPSAAPARWRRPAARPAAQRPDRPPDRPPDLPPDQSPDRPFERPPDRSAEGPCDRPPDGPLDVRYDMAAPTLLGALESDGPDVPPIVDALRDANLAAEVRADIVSVEWSKFVGWSGVSALAARCARRAAAAEMAATSTAGYARRGGDGVADACGG